MKKLILLALCFGLNTANAFELKPFETDYCTAYAEGTREKPELWKHCCLMHDLLFWAGGSTLDRDEADLGLKSCVAETGELKQADLIYWAVRLGRQSPIHISSKQWGNGWKGRVAYQNLTSSEIEQIELEILRGYSFITPQIKALFMMSLWSRME